MLIQSGAWQEASAAPGTPRLLEQVMAHIRRDYIDSLAADAMHERAAVGFVRELDDPGRALLTPEAYRPVREATSGRYAGIGVEIDLRGGFVTIIAPVAGTPADSAGIRPGDRILKVDGRPTAGSSMEEVQEALRGPAGSVVRIVIVRGEEEVPELTLRRRQITYHPMQRAIIAVNGIGYVKLATFGEGAAPELRRAVDSLRSDGARALILDLRENPGGLLEQGIAVADLFLDEGQTIASTRGRTPDANQEFRDEAPQRWPDLPVVVLIDSGSASASEIVAGALQDHGRAVLVGSPSYGKGSAQSLFPAAGGRALKLTTARWYTAKGRTIERDSTSGGIVPDVDLTPKKLPPGGGIMAVGPDRTIARAIQLLDGVRNPLELKARVPREN